MTPIPVELQVIGAALHTIADEMGATLIRAAFSPDVKERRDCCRRRCSTSAAGWSAQAEHIPVHLGAMPEAVAAVTAREIPHPARCGC